MADRGSGYRGAINIHIPKPVMRLPYTRWLTARGVASVMIAICVWVAASLGLLDSTIMLGLDQHLRDFYLSLTVDSRKDNAPGLLHLAFDNEALAAHGLPERVPARAIQDSLALAKGSNHAIVLDIDLATRSDVAEMRGLTGYLEVWGRDPDAALLLLAYPQYEVSYRDEEAFRVVDNIVRASPNIRWAGVGSLADSDGIIRNHEYWSCVPEGETWEVLPSAAFYVWLRAAVASPVQVIELLESGLTASGGPCNGGGDPVVRLGAADYEVPQQGLIEYQTSIDAVHAEDGELGQYAGDGMPRLLGIGYCRINPQACGLSARPAELSELVKKRIVLISAANDFSRDDHLTPVGILSGSVILGNAARALIISGPARPAPLCGQFAMLLAAVAVVLLVWSGMKKLRSIICRKEDRPNFRKFLHGITNPAIVQWLAFAVMNVVVLAYYWFSFPSSEWYGLLAAGFCVTTVKTFVEFRDWLVAPWGEQRKEE